MNIEPTSRQYILRQISKEFRFNGGELPTAIGATAEYIRASCNLLNIDGDEVFDGASVAKICRTTNRRLYPLFSKLLSNTDFVSEQVASLNRIGDVVKISSSRAIIGPIRRIFIDDSHTLLIGGGSMAVLPFSIRGLVEVSGRSRILVGESNSALPIQRLEDWLVLDCDDMVKWAALFLQHNLKFERNIIFPDDLVLWDRYRWIPMSEVMPGNIPYLARRRVTIYGNPSYEYCLIKLKQKDRTLKVSAILRLERETARKLQNLLVSDVNGREKIRFLQVRDGVIQVVINHPIAECYQKIFDLGWLVNEESDVGKWPQRFEFSKALVPLLKRAFSLIGFDLVQDNGGKDVTER